MAASTKLPVTCPVNVFARTKLAASPYPPTKASPSESHVSVARVSGSRNLSSSLWVGMRLPEKQLTPLRIPDFMICEIAESKCTRAGQKITFLRCQSPCDECIEITKHGPLRGSA